MAAGKPLILDTCAVLRLVRGKGLSSAALKRIDETSAVFVSAISGFEIALKVKKGKLQLPQSPPIWFERAAEHHGLSVVPLSLDVCVGAVGLPPIHEDPCDRFIIATAKLNDWIVVSADDRFAKYGVTVIE